MALDRSKEKPPLTVYLVCKLCKVVCPHYLDAQHERTWEVELLA